MPRKPNYLKEAEVKKEARGALVFDSQYTEVTSRGDKQLFITRVCLGCGESQRILVTSIRASKDFTGYCQKCAGEIKLKGVVGKYHPSWKGGIALRNTSIRGMKRMAKKRGYKWELTDKEASALMKEDCFYCGSSPANKRTDPSYKGRTNTSHEYNGIDRVDNNKGYIPKNVVPCCFNCNRSKGDMGLSEWLAHIEKIIARKKLIEVLENGNS